MTVTAITMSVRTTTESNLRSLDTKVRDLCDELDPACIDEHSAPSMDRELEKISDAKDIYRDAVRKFLQDYATELIDAEVEAWKADIIAVVEIVKRNKFAVLAKVNQVSCLLLLLHLLQNQCQSLKRLHLNCSRSSLL